MKTNQPRIREPAVRKDEGYAWVVAMACFSINFLVIGLSRSASVLYMALIDHYKVSRQSATLPFSLRVSMKCFSGPLIGLLGQKYGIRAVTTSGGFFAAFGSIFCYFAPNVFWITIFWGVIHGIGFGLSTVVHMMIINQYFDKYRASALGLGYSGDCFGTFAFPVIMESLLSTYDVKGTFLILGAIVFNVIPLAMLLKKPPWLEDDFHSKHLSKNSGSVNGKDSTKANGSSNHDARSLGYSNKGFSVSQNYLNITGNDDKSSTTGREIAITVSDVSDQPPVYQDIMKMKNEVNIMIPRNSSLSSYSGSVRSHAISPDEFLGEDMERHNSLPPVFELEVTGPCEKNLEDSICVASDDQQISNNDCDNKDTTEEKHVENSSSMKRRRTSSLREVAHEIVHKMRSASFASQVAQEGFIANINQDLRREKEYVSENNANDLPSVEQQKSDTDNLKGNMFQGPAMGEKKFCDGEKEEPSLFKTFLRTNTKPMFLLISLSMAVYAFIFVTLITIIIDYSVDLGVSHDQGKYLIIGFSVADLVGRLSFGQVLDRKLMKIRNYAAVTMFLMGTMVAVIPLNTSFNYMMVCMCCYGLVQGGTAIMFPILVTHYMERNEESIAMGCLNFFAGILMLLMAPMIGYFRDQTGSYNWVFYIIGGKTAFVGLLWQLEPLILRREERKMANHMNESTKL